MSPWIVTTGIGGVVPGILGRAEGAETTGKGLGELLGAPGAGGGGGTDGAETAVGTGAGDGGFGAATGWLTEKGGVDLTGGGVGLETGLGDGGVTRAAVAGSTGGTDTGAGRLTTGGGGVIGGLLCTERGGGGGGATGRGAEAITGAGGRAAFACSSLSRATSCAVLTITPAGDLVVKFCGCSGATGDLGADDGEPELDELVASELENGALDADPDEGSVAVATDLSCPPNSCSIASAEMLSIVLDTLFTSYLRSFSRANNCLLSMLIFFASSWMRMLIQSII